MKALYDFARFILIMLCVLLLVLFIFDENIAGLMITGAIALIIALLPEDIKGQSYKQ